MIDKFKLYRGRLITALDYAFLLSFAVYFLMLFLGTTTFYISFPNHTSAVIFSIMSGVACTKWLLQWNWTKESILGLICAAIYVLAYLFNTYLFLLFLAVLTLGFSQIEYRKIVKWHTLLLGVLLIVTIGCALTGGINNFVYLKDGYIRSSLGIIYPTDLASYVLFFMWGLWVAWTKLPDILVFTFFLLCIWFSKFIAMSSTSTVLSMLSATFVGIHLLYEAFAERKNYTIPPRVRKVVYLGVLAMFPLCVFGILALLYHYDRGSEFALRINNLISNRLYHAVEVYKEKKIHPFGSFFDVYGNGGSIFKVEDYNFIDCTYALILIRYGWVTMLAMGGAWMHTLRKACKATNWRLISVMVLIMIHSLSEHHFPEVNYNIFLVIPLTIIPVEHRQSEHVFKNFNTLLIYLRRVLVPIGVLSLLYCIAPNVMSWLRTLVQVSKWCGYISNLELFLASILLWLLLFTVTWASFNLYKSLFLKWKRVMVYGAIEGATLLVLLFGFVHGQRLIDYGAKRFSQFVYEDRLALESILKASRGDVYVDVFPEIYRRKYPKIRPSVFTGDDLARYYNTTVVMDRGYDSECFIKSGFLYTPISSHHSIYTNDLQVIKSLRREGYHFSGYYNEEKSIDIQLLANMNDLFIDSDGIHLLGENNSLVHGPYVSLHEGTYTVSFELQKNDLESVDDILIGTVYVTAYNGNQELNELKITKNLFDNSGHCTAELSFWSGNYKNIEFLLKMEEGQDLFITNISYKKSPKYDVHSLYNSKRINYRDEYYDLEGNPITTEDGYAAVECNRNSDNVVTEFRYYDRNNQPVMIRGGYARQVRILNARNQVIRLEYYDTENKPVALPQGYSIEIRELDKEGNIIRRRFLDEEGKPVVTNWNYSELRQYYDENHHVVREEYYGTEGEPVNMPQGYAAQEREYDADGNVSMQRFLDADGNPVMTTWNYAEIHREFNEYRQVTRETYFGVDGNPIEMPQGYYIQELEYDDDGNVSIQRFCGIDGQPVMTTWNYAEIHRKYNNKHQSIEDTYYGVNGEQIAMPPGNYMFRQSYDDAGNAIIQQFCNQQGDLMMNIYGYAEVHREFNDKRQVIKETFYDTEGNFAVLPQGYSIRERTYKDDGSVETEIYYDKDGNTITIQ